VAEPLVVAQALRKNIWIVEGLAKSRQEGGQLVTRLYCAALGRQKDSSEADEEHQCLKKTVGLLYIWQT
jgi:hypothetical protein